MKTILKYLTVGSLSILLCMALAIPANAQRGGGGGGGGHFGGGGGGGGHFGGGGGGAHFGGGGAAHFSGGSPARSGGAIRGGAVRGGAARIGGAGGFRGGARPAGVATSHGYVHGNGPGAYGHGGSYGHYNWGRHGGYFFNGGFYGSLYWPWLGFNCWYLPWGYDEFYWDDYPYYLSDGYYYQYNNDEYTVVEPPIGALIKSLPSNAKSIVINGQQYYELNGVYYLPIKTQGGTIQYQIAGKDGELNTDANGAVSVVPKVGDIVTKLPADCRKVSLNGSTMYVSEDGIYYQETTDSYGNRAYKIIGVEAGNTGN